MEPEKRAEIKGCRVMLALCSNAPYDKMRVSNAPQKSAPQVGETHGAMCGCSGKTTRTQTEMFSILTNVSFATKIIFPTVGLLPEPKSSGYGLSAPAGV